jgi:anti-sigma factor RsiW
MMEVTRDVIGDLLPLYLAGEVSADTRALVEHYLSRNPDLARAVAAARALELPPTPAPAPTSEKTALDETRRLLKTRSSTLATAAFFTALPFAFTFDSSGVTFLLIRDEPVVGAAWLFTAAVLWAWHVYVRRQLRVSGL